MAFSSVVLAKPQGSDILKLANPSRQQVDDCFVTDPDARNLLQNLRSDHFYYYFHELFEEQYKLGEEGLTVGDMSGGHYSMCVGAAELATKFRKSGNKVEAQMWAERALDHFRAFERLRPDWFNINSFVAMAATVLGHNDEAMALFRDQYRKQGRKVDEKETHRFEAEVTALMNESD
ncbi:hypothetical protein [Oligoflexus sp.]|uniref:hypothetical protein n=1 Tax=Oligoflexus sp. TaxID=1971216 RepID=UPI002D788A95|nr:hypothetical protein [Oligoflexus sp.]